jgi:hypothetical protein
MIRGLLRRFFAARRAFRGAPAPAHRAPVDARVAADPWLRALFDDLGERYQLGADGAQVLRRTARTRFNPMRVWVRGAEHEVIGEYQVRSHGDREAALAQARSILDARVTLELRELGLAADGDAVEEWGGHVLTRRYRGRCDDAVRAAAAVRFMCQGSEQLIDTAAE